MVSKKLKILYVDLEYDYGIQARGGNAIGQDGFKKSLERLGHEVFPFYYDNFLRRTDKLQTHLCQYADAVEPDLIFFSLLTNQFEKETLNYLKSKYVTVNWFGDDQWRFDNFTKLYANYFTWCISTDKYAIPKYKAIGQKNIIYSQWAAINEHKVDVLYQDYQYDVSFVGGYHPYRKWFIHQLSKLGVSVEVFGNGWPNGPLKSREMNNIFFQSKVNLNIANSNSFDFRYLISSPRALALTIKSRKGASQIKARNFEIPYFGGFQVTDYVPSLEDYFDIGKEIVCYTSPYDAALQIRYYLENDIEREKIKNNGHHRAVSEHGYLHRLTSILEEII